MFIYVKSFVLYDDLLTGIRRFGCINGKLQEPPSVFRKLSGSTNIISSYLSSKMVG